VNQKIKNKELTGINGIKNKCGNGIKNKCGTICP
jgi:hypothetical protein